MFVIVISPAWSHVNKSDYSYQTQMVRNLSAGGGNQIMTLHNSGYS